MVVVAACVVAGLLHSGHASACSCIQTSLQGEFNTRDAVFEATLLEATSEDRQQSPKNERVRLKVLRIWKGLEDNPTTIEVLLPAGAVWISGESPRTRTGHTSSDLRQQGRGRGASGEVRPFYAIAGGRDGLQVSCERGDTPCALRGG